MKVEEVPLDRIKPSTINQREEPGDLMPLRKSIRQRIKNGKRPTIHPILVREIDEPDFDYEVIAGSRRLQACALEGVRDLTVFVETEKKNLEDLEWTSYHENESRKDLEWWEKADFFIAQEKLGMTQGEIAKKAGMSRTIINEYINARKTLKGVAQATSLDFTVAREIAQKCPRDELEEFTNYAANNVLTRREVVNSLFALINFDSSLEILEDFNPKLAKEMKELYFPHKYNPKAYALFQKERDLRTGQAGLRNVYLDIKEYPDKKSAEEYAKVHHGKLVGKVTVKGWQVKIIPYTREEIRKKLEEVTA